MTSNERYYSLMLIGCDMGIATNLQEQDNDAPYTVDFEKGIISINHNHGIKQSADSLRDGLTDLIIHIMSHDNNPVYKDCLAHCFDALAEMTRVIADLPEEEAKEALFTMSCIISKLRAH